MVEYAIINNCFDLKVFQAFAVLLVISEITAIAALYLKSVLLVLGGILYSTNIGD